MGMLFALFITEGLQAQSRIRLRELEKMQETHEQDEEQAREEARKRHLSIQSKQTLREMKRYEKMSKRHNKNKRPLFTRKRKSRKRK
ncbi:MAG: hypothetical protein Kow0075_15600 [Salibacteraceae bacterium]